MDGAPITPAAHHQHYITTVDVQSTTIQSVLAPPPPRTSKIHQKQGTTQIHRHLVDTSTPLSPLLPLTSAYWALYESLAPIMSMGQFEPS